MSMRVEFQQEMESKQVQGVCWGEDLVNDQVTLSNLGIQVKDDSPPWQGFERLGGMEGESKRSWAMIAKGGPLCCWEIEVLILFDIKRLQS